MVIFMLLHSLFLQMVEPAYQELEAKDIPHVTKNGVHVTVIAGESLGASVSCMNPGTRGRGFKLAPLVEK